MSAAFSAAFLLMPAQNPARHRGRRSRARGRSPRWSPPRSRWAGPRVTLPSPILSVPSPTVSVMSTSRPAPVVPAERLDLVDQLHGQPVADPYRWLEDASDGRTEKWAEAEDEVFSAASAVWPGRERVGRRLGELLASGVVGVPIWRGGRAFSMRREPGQQHRALHGQEE